MASPPPSPSPSPAHSKKPDFQLPKPPSMSHQIPTKSHSNPLCKTLIIVLLLLAIPLFPSQAPDFITQNIFITQFWEIIHLIFIGIAVSYGLFSRKSSEMGSEKTVISGNDHGPHAYLSGISHLSSVFEDGFENLCGPDELNMIEKNYSDCDNDALFLGKDRNFGSFVSKDGIENVKKVNEAWRSEYSKGEPLVVVSNGKYFLDGGNDFKPLNLPVRSLRTTIVDPELRNRGEFSPKFESNGFDSNDTKVVKIRGVTPTNLEKKFEEASGTPPRIPWRSRSSRMESGGKMGNDKAFVHYRPHSVGEFEFEDFKARSLRGVTFSSSPELSSSEVETNHRTKVPLDADVSFGGAKTRPFEYNVKNFEGKLGKGKQGIESLDSDVKSLGIGKGLSRAKSVRTIKPSRYVVDEKEKYPSQVEGTFGRTFKRGRAEEPENPQINYQKHEFDSIFPMPKPNPTLLKFHNEEKEDIDDGNITECDENETKSEDDNRNNSVENDVELEGSEVDRKAGEFIAKFREQIRLQKMSSVRR